MIIYDGHKVYMNGEYPATFINGKNVHIHRLEWNKYYGDIPDGCIIHHKNGNKLDWDISNLELLTRAEHKIEHKDSVKRKGIKCIGVYKYSVYRFDNVRQASKATGATECGIHRCLNGIQKQSNGWIFVRGWVL